MRKYLPDPDFFIGKDIPGISGYTIIEHIGSGCNAHVFRAHSDNANRDIACKIIPAENLIGKDAQPPLWRQEIDKAHSLKSQMAVKFYHVDNWITGDIDCIVLCSEYVVGETLEKHIKKYGVSVTFVEQFLKNMLSFIHDMEQNNVQHGDLHDKNIMVEDRSDQLGGDKFAFRVTDFGVASVSDEARFKDDYDQLALMLRQLLQKVDYQKEEARNKYAFNILNDQFLASYLAEKDTTREPSARQTSKLYRLLEQIESDFNIRQKEKNEEQSQLITPFDYLSCEQIGESHSLLKALYSNSFLGLPFIESRNNLVLTGPRGCGKSTVFKSLSLRHRCLIQSDSPEDIRYIGIYYRCDDLYWAFPRYRLPERQEAYDIPMHYLTATLISEILVTIEMWSNRHFKEDFSRLEKSISNEIWDILGLEFPREPGAASFKFICSHLQKERLRAQNKQPRVHVPDEPIEGYFGPGVLLEICNLLTARFAFLHDNPFYFFIDDYSMPKITEDLQRNLNRLLMQRTSCAFFKLSTESPVSYAISDIDKKAYVEGREFSLLNLGLEYLVRDRSKEKIQFIEDIFRRRFGAIPGYPVKTIDELIGSYQPPKYNVTGLAIRDGDKPDMWGKKILCELCSGDIFYIIRLVGRMVSKGGNLAGIEKSKQSPLISRDTQKGAIRDEAGYFLNNLRGIEGGEKLVEIVTAFGRVAHSYLKFKNSKNEENNPPWLASRIEPYEKLNLKPEAQKVYEELLRYSLFIEDPRGKSRRGKVVPRLHLRRALLPHFNLTFSKRDSIELENWEIEKLLLEPTKFEKYKTVREKEEDDQVDGIQWYLPYKEEK